MTELSTVAGLGVTLGLGAEGLALDIPPDTLATDLDPWLLDLCAVGVAEIGHAARVPRAWDWEHLLPLLQPGEELLWVVEYTRDAPQPFALKVALKANAGSIATPGSLRMREERFRALTSSFRRQAFPESVLRRLAPDEAWALGNPEDLGSTWCVTGIPSPKDLPVDESAQDRDEEAPSHQSLNDIVEAFLHLPAFRLTFVVGRLPDDEVDREFKRVTTLRNHVHPLVRQQVSTAEQVALSWQDSTTDSTAKAKSRQEGDSLFEGIHRGLAQLVAGSREGARWEQLTWTSAPANLSKTTTRGRTRGTGGQVSQGTTVNTERLDSALELIDESLRRYADNLYGARASGAFRGACIVQAPDGSCGVLASSLKGVLSGPQSRDRPMTAFPLTGRPLDLLRTTAPTLSLLNPAAPILTDVQACRLLLLPEAELPGVRLHRSVFLGRNASPAHARNAVALGHLAFSTSAAGAAQVLLDRDDLFRHVLIAGTTGSGKTRRLLAILNGLPPDDDLRIVVIETAKRTYRGQLARNPSDPPRVYTLGESTAAPLRINPFYFEPGTSLKRHISVLADALSELMPTEALIGPKLREAVEKTYLELGWDVESGGWAGTEDPVYPSPIGFVHQVRQVADALNYGAEVSANYRGALEGRARLFLDATFQDIFSHGGNASLEELFDRDTIIEMEGLPTSEVDVPAFLVALLLERLRSHQQKHRNRRWLVVVEEAHNVLPRSAEESRSGREADGGHTLVKNLVRLLQEGREMGIGLVVLDQAPTMLARGVVKNTNTKIVMRLEDAEEIEEMGQALALKEEAWADLGVLRQGEAIVKAPYMTQPVKSAAYASHELDFPSPQRGPLEAPPPPYPELERRWAAVLHGVGPAPDEAWWAELLAMAEGDVELVRFSLGRALLEHPLGDEELPGFDRLPADAALLKRARAWDARARGAHLSTALLPLVQAVAACQDLAERGARPTMAGVHAATRVLGESRREELERLALRWQSDLGLGDLVALILGWGSLADGSLPRPGSELSALLMAERLLDRVGVRKETEVTEALARAILRYWEAR